MLQRYSNATIIRKEAYGKGRLSNVTTKLVTFVLFTAGISILFDVAEYQHVLRHWAYLDAHILPQKNVVMRCGHQILVLVDYKR